MLTVRNPRRQSGQ
ncbi:hypothetical protein S40285_09106, partial [Stachybotrys chlorohalonatus IBT 40285]